MIGRRNLLDQLLFFLERPPVRRNTIECQSDPSNFSSSAPPSPFHQQILLPLAKHFGVVIKQNKPPMTYEGCEGIEIELHLFVGMISVDN